MLVGFFWARHEGSCRGPCWAQLKKGSHGTARHGPPIWLVVPAHEPLWADSWCRHGSLAIVNGKEVRPIIPSRGLRQCDPLSPYLFILCAKGLSSLIRKHEKAGLIHGVKVAGGAPMVSHLFFADDSFLFFLSKPTRIIFYQEYPSILWACFWATS